MTIAGAPRYTPFPDFQSWHHDEVSFRDVDAATRRFSDLKEKVSVAALDAALDAALRTAAVDTNAIEGVFTTDRGFTRTVAARSGAWELMMEQQGPHARPAFEDTLAGFELIFDHMTGLRPVTETFMRELHTTMLRSQDTHTVYTSIDGRMVQQQHDLPKGTYKENSNSPTRADGTVHAYAPPEDTAPEMARLVHELQSEEFAAARPVSQAAYAHYAFVCIHPFADGNGRVARALASVYLYRSPGVPLVIYSDQRTAYLDALEAADSGRHHRFIRFLAERVTDTVNTLEAELTAAMIDEPSTAELSELLRTKAVPVELHDSAARLKELVRDGLQAEIDRRAGEIDLPVRTIGSLIGRAPTPPHGYATINDDLATSLAVTTNAPLELSVFWPVAICLSTSDVAEFDLLAMTPSGHQLGVYLREVHPTIAENLRTRIGYFCRVAYADFLSRVTEAARRSAEIRDSGT